MLHDPREFRIYAIQCVEMAGRTRSPEMKANLLELSANWMKLAASMDATQALLAHDPDDAFIAVPDGAVPSLSIH